MTQKNRRAYSVAAVVLAVSLLLTGCGLKDIPVIGGFFQWIEEMSKNVASDSSPETTKPAQTDSVESSLPETEPTETEPLYYWVQAQGGLNVRSGPGQNYEVMGRLDNGTRVIPLKWENGWAYIDHPYVGWCSGEYLVETAPNRIEPSDILGSWHAARGSFGEDGLFYMIYGDYWTFNLDGTFTCSENESMFIYDTNGVEQGILGTGSLSFKGTYTFDGLYLEIVVTHRDESSGGPFDVELEKPEYRRGMVTLVDDTVVVDWEYTAEKFYRESGDALLVRLMQEQS